MQPTSHAAPRPGSPQAAAAERPLAAGPGPIAGRRLTHERATQGAPGPPPAQKTLAVPSSSSAPVQVACPRFRSKGHTPGLPKAAALTCGILCGLAGSAAAADLGTIGGFDVRLDSGLGVSLGLRVAPQDPALLDLVNADDGDRAFAEGPISERLDVSETLDATSGAFGVEIGADGWYDAAYHGTNANRSPATFNPVTVAHDMFPADVRRLMGGTVELGPAYVRYKFDLDGLPISLRIGRQTLLWGESLFFAQDGIAGAQAPLDLIKGASQPLAPANQLYLPVAQADIRLQLPFGLSLEAYDQAEWRRDRVPGVASYFSTSDVLDTGGQRLFTAGGSVLFRAQDDTPSAAGLGQFGVALLRDGGTLGLGLYALRYNAKSPAIDLGVAEGTYRLVFPRGIDLLGASISTYAGDATLAGEVSFRRNLPLVSRFQPLTPSLLPSASVVPALPPPPQAGFATGQTLTGLASYERLLPPGRLWDVANLQAEAAATQLVSVQTNPGDRLPGSTSFSSALQVVLTPTWYNVRRDLNVSVPAGFRIGLAGKSSVDAGEDAGTGTLTLGISATYRTVWQTGLSYTHYLGAPRLQPLADRDFVLLSLVRTF